MINGLLKGSNLLQKKPKGYLFNSLSAVNITLVNNENIKKKHAKIQVLVSSYGLIEAD